MPAFVVGKVADALNDRGKPVKGSKVALLGMAYKKDVDDPRESPGFELMDLLLEEGRGGQLQRPAHPPAAADAPLPAPAHGQPGADARIPGGQDCVLIVTDHSAYDWSWIVEHCAAGRGHAQRDAPGDGPSGADCQGMSPLLAMLLTERLQRAAQSFGKSNVRIVPEVAAVPG